MIGDERNSFTGRANLASTVIVAVVAVLMLVPSVWIGVLRIFFSHQIPSWTFALPFVGFVGVVVLALVSLKLITKRPPS